MASSFEQVVSAQIDRERFIQEARVYERDIIPRARGTAAETVLEAEAYKNTAVTRSTGAAQSFTLQRKAFEKTRDITQTRMVLETMEEALSDVKKIIVQPSEKGKKPDLWLNVPGGTE